MIESMWSTAVEAHENCFLTTAVSKTYSIPFSSSTSFWTTFDLLHLQMCAGFSSVLTEKKQNAVSMCFFDEDNDRPWVTEGILPLGVGEGAGLQRGHGICWVEDQDLMLDEVMKLQLQM